MFLLISTMMVWIWLEFSLCIRSVFKLTAQTVSWPGETKCNKLNERAQQTWVIDRTGREAKSIVHDFLYKVLHKNYNFEELEFFLKLSPVSSRSPASWLIYNRSPDFEAFLCGQCTRRGGFFDGNICLWLLNELRDTDGPKSNRVVESGIHLSPFFHSHSVHLNFQNM